MSEYTVYSKRNCSYCVRAIELLESKGLQHTIKKIDEDQSLFLELREKAKISLGKKFDIRDFHEVILSQGTVTLSILEQRINNYINKTKKK